LCGADIFQCNVVDFSSCHGMAIKIPFYHIFDTLLIFRTSLMYSTELPANLVDFAELLRRVLAGEEVILSQAGTPIARIVPLTDQSLPRIPGLDRGKVVIAPNFNEPLPEDVLNDFLNPLDIQNESTT